MLDERGDPALRDSASAGVRVRLLQAGDEALLTHPSADLFDNETQPHLVAEFLADPRHHLAVALDGDRPVGFATGVHYIHPDKPAELWINEVGVVASHRRTGVAARLMHALFDAGREAGCVQAWVLTERSNPAALGLYASIGGVEPIEDVVMFEFGLNTDES